MMLARVLFWCLLCGASYANSIILTSVDAPLGQQQTLWINEQGTNTLLYWAGGINASVDGHARVLWCVELFVDINLNTTYNTTVDWADTPSLKRVGWLMHNVVSGVTTQTQGAALQLAIWDIIEDGGDGLNPGAGKVYKSTDASHPTDAAVLSLALQYESQSQGKLYDWVPVYHNVIVSDGSPVQDLIGEFVRDGGPLSELPEPEVPGMVFGGLALMAAGWRRRRSCFSLVPAEKVAAFERDAVELAAGQTGVDSPSTTSICAGAQEIAKQQSRSFIRPHDSAELTHYPQEDPVMPLSQ
jgi:hypothetical protein